MLLHGAWSNQSPELHSLCDNEIHMNPVWRPVCKHRLCLSRYEVETAYLKDHMRGHVTILPVVYISWQNTCH